MQAKHPKHPKHPKHQAGFTLLELLITLTILSLLVTIVAPRVMQYLDSSKVKTAEIQIAAIRSALHLYRIDVGVYPSQEMGLESLVEMSDDARDWNGPYLDNKVALLDPWGTAYQYKMPGGDSPFDIISLGADGKEGGDGVNEDIIR